ncbi:MAG: hypothetical protein H8D32_02830 [Dehalococcoidia bacterium]|nr:hypothetical protein [Dehalococcoidia bacterium]
MGEFEINSKQGEAFVEVKTLFGDSAMLDQRDLLSRIADYLEEKKLPVRSINLTHYPNDLSKVHLKAVTGKIESFLLTSVPTSSKYNSKKTVEYQDGSGLVIEFELSSGASTIQSMAYGGWVDVDDNLRYKLGMPVEGRKSRIQVSARDIPSFVVICDPGDWANRRIEGMLYGSKVTILGNKAQKGREYRRKDGKWDNQTMSDLSAVGVFQEDFSNQKFPKCVEMYLCPSPRFPLSKHLFTDSTIRWLRLADDNISVVQDVA